jgi:predicted ATPase/class 3 adenylate cyclase
MEALPSGVLTLLFTDIENSSSMWDSHRSDMAVALVRHNEILRTTIGSHQGFVVKDKGDGFFAAFFTPAAAVACALDVQRQIATEPWPETIDLKVRMGVHTGTVEAHEGDYHGPTVNQVARIEGLAYGGQVLLSEATVTLLGGDYSEGAAVVDMGKHTLKGISRAVQLFQLTAPDLPAEFPPLVTAGRSGVPLPEFATSFVGREDDRTALGEVFTANGARLVTLLGPGGIGKTRLAVETAREVSQALGSEAFFADLTSIQQAPDVPGVLAAALGVHAEGAASPVQLVAERVTDPTLLVVDNFEHVQDAKAVIGELISAVGSMRMLATSRSPLEVQGERIYRVEPLSLANGDGRPPPAVQLFYDRAAGYGVALPLSGTQANAVRSIVERVDGLPLGIELVAARTRVLSVTEIDERLRESMNVIGRGGAELPERQRTLQSTIDWSLGNVTESQRMLFRRLAALPAGGSLRVLEEVVDFDLEEDLLDALQGLIDNSLVWTERGLPGGTRYRQLMPMRDYGLDQLRSGGQEDVVMGRLVDYYVGHSEEFGRRFEFGSDTEQELKTDHQNLLAEMRWSLAHGRASELAEAFNRF